MIILAIITTIIIGFIGAGLGHDYMNSAELGTILAVATMGGFIMAEIRRKNHGG